MDDIVLSGNDLIEIQNITQLLDCAFKIKDLGDLKFLVRVLASCLSFVICLYCIIFRKIRGVNFRSGMTI